MSEIDTDARIYVTRAGRSYEFSADPVTAAALLQLVDRRRQKGHSTTIHASPDRHEGMGARAEYVLVVVSSAEDLVVELEDALSKDASKASVIDREESLGLEHSEHGYVTLHETSTV